MIHNLVISGGQTKTLAVIGALVYLEEQGLLDEVTHAVGCSAGAIVCLMLVLGYRPSEMEGVINRFMIGRKRHHLNLDAMLSIFEEHGLDRGENLLAFLRDVLHDKMGCVDMTFIELAKRTGRNLVLCVANVTEQRTEYLDVDNSPDMSILLAIRMSCSLPILFTPVAYRGCIYADGALYENLPIGYIDAKCSDELRDTLAISTFTKMVPPTSLDRGGGFGAYVSFLFSSIHLKACEPRRISPKIKVVEIEFEEDLEGTLGGVGLDFNDDELVAFPLNSEMLKAYVRKGYESMLPHALSGTP
jgi:predicted acylesterase/phospholipase RssA